MRKQLVGIVLVLERVQPRQLPFRVPSQRPFVAVPIVDVDFDVAGGGAARRDEDAARAAADLGRHGVEGAIGEADFEEAGVGRRWPVVFFFLCIHFVWDSREERGEGGF